MNIVSRYFVEAQTKLINKNKILFFKTHSANYAYDNLFLQIMKPPKGAFT
jgi:hypothetical protein